MKTRVRKGVPVSSAFVPVFCFPRHAPVHPPAPSPYIWPQPGACQLLPPPVWLWPPPWTLLLPVPPLQARPILTWSLSCPGPQPPGKEGPLLNSRGLCAICPHPSSVGSCHQGRLRCRCVWGMAVLTTFQPPRSCLAPQCPCAPQLWLCPLLVSCQPSSRGLVHFTKLEAAAHVYSWSPQAVTRLTPSRARLVS